MELVDKSIVLPDNVKMIVNSLFVQLSIKTPNNQTC